MDRRTAVRACGCACVGGLAGCSFIESVLEDALDREASPAVVPESVLAETSYEHDSRDEWTVAETLEVGGESREVSLTNKLTRYRLGLDSIEFDRSWFVLFTSPTVSLAGQEANPFWVLDEETLVERLLGRVDTAAVQDVEKTGEREIELLGEPQTVTEFEGSTEFDIDVRIDLSQRTHSGDVLVVLAVYPELTALAEDIDTLAAGAEHPAPEEQSNEDTGGG